MTTEVRDSATSSGAVTKSDSTVLEFDSLYVGAASGNIAIKHTAGGAVTTYVNVPVGRLKVKGVRVMAATTSTEIIWEKW